MSESSTHAGCSPQNSSKFCNLLRITRVGAVFSEKEPEQTKSSDLVLFSPQKHPKTTETAKKRCKIVNFSVNPLKIAGFFFCSLILVFDTSPTVPPTVSPKVPDGSPTVSPTISRVFPFCLFSSILWFFFCNEIAQTRRFHKKVIF